MIISVSVAYIASIALLWSFASASNKVVVNEILRDGPRPRPVLVCHSAQLCSTMDACKLYNILSYRPLDRIVMNELFSRFDPMFIDYVESSDQTIVLIPQEGGVTVGSIYIYVCMYVWIEMHTPSNINNIRLYFLHFLLILPWIC